MITVTDTAKAELDAYFATNAKSPIRIFLAPGGCAGPRLSLALDEPSDADEVSAQGDYTFVVEKELFNQAKPMVVDASHMGFSVDSQLQLGGGSCGGCSGGSCGG